MKKISKLQQLKSDWDNCNKIKIFEIPVTDKKTGEDDYIIFDIEIVGRSFIATHVALTEREERSKKIAFKKIVIDADFCLNENLVELYEECMLAIIESDFYELQD